ncbi:MAG: hypothetical protein JO352_05070 [Chloroflexi bacterium]|nr:hypothetical protein [Chloroflexota bacterium]MBV9598791.1 hypothetical protein [Chloroflexota bacterium]
MRSRVVLAVGRQQEVRLLEALQADMRQRLVARVTTAADLVRLIEDGQADVAVLDEDLHALSQDLLNLLAARHFPFVFLARNVEACSWRVRGGLVLPATSESGGMLDALPRALSGEPHSRRTKSGKATTSTQPARNPATDTPEPHVPEASDAPDRQRRRFGLIVFWGGAAAGRTLLALSTGALLGSVAPTITVDLDTTGASLCAYLDDGTRGLADRHLVALAQAAPTTAEAWQRELALSVQPLGPYSPKAHVLCGVPWAKERSKLSGPFVERLLVELRARYDYVLVDLGDEPLSGLEIEAVVGHAALRGADHVLVVATPDAVCLHRTRTALADASDLLVRQRASLVLNRCRKLDPDEVELATELPVVAMLPDDSGPVRRALERGWPVVCEPDSRLRRPLGELVERIHGGAVDLRPTADKPAAWPAWPRVRTVLANAPALGSLFGGSPG